MSSNAPNELERYAQAMDALNSPSNEILKSHEFEHKLRMHDHPEGFDVAGHEKNSGYTCIAPNVGAISA
jgi:hypothetical protein